MIGSLIVFITNLWRGLRNGWRRLWRRRVDYVQIELSGSLPEFAPAPTWWQRRFLGASTSLSLGRLRRMLQRIAADPQASGVLLRIDGLAAGWATLQSLHDELRRFRAGGKRVVAYLLTPDSNGYYAACAADTIIAPPAAFFNVLGIRAEVQFLKDALERAGLQAELEAVSPYKSAGEPFVRSDISPENREQLERLIEQRYAELIQVIATARGKPEAEVRTLIDQAPLSVPAGVAAGLFDYAAYEDELAGMLGKGQGEGVGGQGSGIGGQGEGVGDQGSGRQAERESGGQAGRPERGAIIRDWPQAQRALRLVPATFQQRAVAVVSVEGTITGGRSRSLPIPLPLVGGRQAGSDSIIQALRQAERNRRVAAVVVYVNSPGGDSFASDLIWREVLRLRQQKPVVVAMGNTAASGGYYIAAPASAIIAQPGTLTGSIGVFSLRLNAASLLERVNVNTVVISRGAHSGLLSSAEPLSADTRAALRQQVDTIYTDFKQRVRAGRSLAEAQLEPIAGGRVWTGREALGLQLVDTLGGLPEALLKAQELAGLPQNRQAGLLLLGGGRSNLAPQPFPANGLAGLAELPELLEELLTPRIWAALPFVGRGLY